MTRRRFLLSTGACAVAQSVQTKAEIKGKKIVDDALAALGGNAYLTMEDRTETGRAYSYYHDQISGLSIAIGCAALGPSGRLATATGPCRI